VTCWFVAFGERICALQSLNGRVWMSWPFWFEGEFGLAEESGEEAVLSLDAVQPVPHCGGELVCRCQAEPVDPAVVAIVAVVVAAMTAAIISPIALRTACDAQLSLAISSARALSSCLDRPCCRGSTILSSHLSVQEGDQRGGPRVWCRLLHERLGHQSADLCLVAGILSRPPVGWEDAEDLALPGANYPAVGQPLIQRLA